MFFLVGSNWQLGVGLMMVAAVCLGSAQVVYDSLLLPDRQSRRARRRLLARLGPGVPRRWPPLAINLALVTIKPFGLDTETTVRISLLSAGLW